VCSKMEITTTIHKTENPDSLEIGTPSKLGAVKIYGDFADAAAFQNKVDNAVTIREYAMKKLGSIAP